MYRINKFFIDNGLKDAIESRPIARNVLQTRPCNSLFDAFKVKWIQNVSRENSSKGVGGNKLR